MIKYEELGLEVNPSLYQNVPSFLMGDKSGDLIDEVRMVKSMESDDGVWS